MLSSVELVLGAYIDWFAPVAMAAAVPGSSRFGVDGWEVRYYTMKVLPRGAR